MALGTLHAFGVQLFGYALLGAIVVGVPTYVLQRRLKKQPKAEANVRFGKLVVFGRILTAVAGLLSALGVLLTL